MLLHDFTHKAYNDKVERIKPALDRIVLKEYGGSLTITEFRDLNTESNKECQIV